MNVKDFMNILESEPQTIQGFSGDYVEFYKSTIYKDIKELLRRGLVETLMSFLNSKSDIPHEYAKGYAAAFHVIEERIANLGNEALEVEQEKGKTDGD